MANVQGKSMNKDLLKLDIKSDRLSRKGNSTARNYGSSDRDQGGARQESRDSSQAIASPFNNQPKLRLHQIPLKNADLL